MKRKILAALIALFTIGGSVSAFAVWDNLTATKSETLTIGQGGVTLTVAVEDVVPVGAKLVPTTAALKTGDVKSIVLTYNVKLDTAVVSPLAFTVTADAITINNVSTYSSLVNIGIVKEFDTVNTNDVLVTVTITLTEPTSQAEYEAIINQAIAFNLNFVATPQ